MALTPSILRFIADEYGLDTSARSFTSDYLHAVGRSVREVETHEAKKRTLNRLRRRSELDPVQDHPGQEWIWEDYARAIGYPETLRPLCANFFRQKEHTPARRRAAVAFYVAATKYRGEIFAAYARGQTLLEIGSEADEVVPRREPAVAALARDLHAPITEWPALALKAFEEGIRDGESRAFLTPSEQRFLLRTRVGRVSALVELGRALESDLRSSMTWKRRLLLLNPYDVTMGVSGLYSAAYLAVALERRTRAEGALLMFARRLARAGLTDLGRIMYHGRVISGAAEHDTLIGQLDAWIRSTLVAHKVLIEDRLVFAELTRQTQLPRGRGLI